MSARGMSRKHFKALAAALRASRPQLGTTAWGAWRDSVDAVAAVCRSTNSRFDISRFLDACGAE